VLPEIQAPLGAESIIWSGQQRRSKAELCHGGGSTNRSPKFQSILAEREVDHPAIRPPAPDDARAGGGT
jgi:hypothetical protein